MIRAIEVSGLHDISKQNVILRSDSKWKKEFTPAD